MGPRQNRKRSPPTISNKGKATTAGALGGALSAWFAYELQRRFNVPTEIAGEILSIVTGAISALIARWATNLDPRG